MNAAQAATTNRICWSNLELWVNGQRCAGDKELLTERLRQSCGLTGSAGVTTVFPPGNSFLREFAGMANWDEQDDAMDAWRGDFAVGDLCGACRQS
jgi:hypothetical protein